MSGSRRSFDSDNVAPVAPEVMAALARVNHGTTHSYGDDPETRRLTVLAREIFETELVIHPVATGTAANALALAAVVPPFGAVLCHELAHINTDECGAPEFFSGGAKLLTLGGPDGKISAAQLVAPVVHARAMGVHHVLPAAISVSQATEWGTVYRRDELAELAAAAHDHGLRVHMDGARFANAVATLGCTPAEVTWQAGVDALSFGFVKNGAMSAEALVFFKPGLAGATLHRRKRAGLLVSKGRYLAAQVLSMLDDDLWLDNARAANASAATIAAAAGARLVHPVEANEVFLRATPDEAAALRAQGFDFYDWAAGEIRLVTAWDSPAEQVALLAQAITQL